MTKLKLGAIADDKPVKLTVELPADVHRDLAAYADVLARETGKSISQPARLIAPMLVRFMATDRACKDAPQGSACATRGIALAQQFEEVCQRRIIIVLAPMC
jgi:hypothetical protein